MSVRRSLVWSLSGQLYATVLLFVGTVVVARLVTPAEMGVYALGFAIAGLLNVFTAVGLNSYVVREADFDDARARTAFSANFIICGMLIAALFGLSWPAAAFMRSDGVGEVMRVLALRPIFMIAEFIPAAMLQREMRFGTLAIVQAASATANVAIMIGTALMGWSYMSVAFGLIAGSVISSIAVILASPGYRFVGFGLSYWRPLLGFSANILSISGLALMTYRISEMIVGRILGLAALGIFTRASQLLDFLYFNLYGAGTRVLFSKLAADYREGRGLSANYLRSLDLITALIWPLAGGIAILAGPAVYILYGAQYQAAAGPLAFLMVALAIYSAFAMHWELFVITGETSRMPKIEVVRSIISVCALMIGLRWGILGASAGRIAESVVGLILYLGWVKKLASVKSSQLAAIYARSLLLTAAAVAPAAAIMFANNWNPRISFVAVALAVGAGGAGWLLAIALTRHVLFDELATALRSLVRR